MNALPGGRIMGFSPPASMITDPNDPTFLAGQSLAQAICDQEGSAYSAWTSLVYVLADLIHSLSLRVRSDVED